MDYQIYDLGRSVSDCIRFKEKICPDIYQMIIENYQKQRDAAQINRMLAYAKRMKFENQMKEALL